MTDAERLALLGADTIADINAQAAAAPEPTDELVEELRRIMTRPGGVARKPRPAVDAA
ncbi:hypothetical protein [Streptomyces sp. NPDC001139]